MARKRSLKDAAADQLVEKNNFVPEAPVAQKKNRQLNAAAFTHRKWLPPQKAPPGQPPLAEPSKAPENKEKSRPCLMWIAISLLIGFVGGYFFGVGQAMGPANVAYLLIGSIGGYLCGRFIKII